MRARYSLQLIRCKRRLLQKQVAVNCRFCTRKSRRHQNLLIRIAIFQVQTQTSCSYATRVSDQHPYLCHGNLNREDILYRNLCIIQVTVISFQFDEFQKDALGEFLLYPTTSLKSFTTMLRYMKRWFVLHSFFTMNITRLGREDLNYK